MLDTYARQVGIKRFAATFGTLVGWNRYLVGRVGIWRRGERLGLVEKPELVGIGLLGTRPEALVRCKSKLLLEALDLKSVNTDDGLERPDVIGQIARCIAVIAHGADTI